MSRDNSCTPWSAQQIGRGKLASKQTILLFRVQVSCVHWRWHSCVHGRRKKDDWSDDGVPDAESHEIWTPRPKYVRILKKCHHLTRALEIALESSLNLWFLNFSVGLNSWTDYLFFLQSILVQIRSEILSDPNCRLDLSSDVGYSEQEAKEAFDRMVLKYGWNK